MIKTEAQARNEIIEKIKSEFKSGDNISISFIQKLYKTSYMQASSVFNHLVGNGFVIKGINNSVSKIA